jgi:phosphoglycolate phosphatase-like HAD superfamily hydrolase
VLLLFDIDGTLVRGANAAHAQALHAALRRVHGVDSEAIGLSISPAGRTDGEIARAILLDAGVSAERIDARWDRVREETCRLYAQLVEQDLSGFVIDGVPSLLEWLSGVEGARLSLVTGNFQAVARLKLRRAGLGGFFEPGQGGFGSDSEDRLALPGIARRRAGRRGVPWPRERTVVIGDTPRDIACAHADGLRCLAVATGPIPASELRDADAVAADTGELRALLEQLLAELSC